MTLDAVDFISRSVLQVLTAGFAKIRLLGLLANGN
jgi:anti-anti-sigma regulatory factor